MNDKTPGEHVQKKQKRDTRASNADEAEDDNMADAESAKPQDNSEKVATSHGSATAPAPTTPGVALEVADNKAEEARPPSLDAPEKLVSRAEVSITAPEPAKDEGKAA